MRRKTIIIIVAAIVGFVLWQKFGDQIVKSVRTALKK